jgi:hypothetical protein
VKEEFRIPDTSKEESKDSLKPWKEEARIL